MFFYSFRKLLNKLYLINALYRRLIFISFDVFLLYVSSILILFIKGSLNNDFYLVLYSISIPTFIFTGQYKGITKYNGTKILYEVFIRNIFLIFLSVFICKILNIEILDLKNLVLILIIYSGIIISSRIVIRDLLFTINNSKEKKKKILIYGGGEAGSLLQASLKLENTHHIVAFIDDNPNLWGRSINGTKIISFKDVEKLTQKIDQIIFAIPSLQLNKKKLIFKKIAKLSIPILQLPSIKEIVTGKISINNLRPINIEDILNRNSVKPNEKLVESAIKNQTICVTGAAGSIGSELCNQILKIGPKELIFIDNSEPSLYKIEKELGYYSNFFKLSFILGDVTDYKMLLEIFKEKSVEIVYHSAAYKHVPIVEKNPIQGLRNNYLSTKSVCEASKNAFVKKVVLISSDKAVRPTNIMGASKRLSEIIIQEYAKEAFIDKEKNKTKTIFTMVRFGNVLNSSGSVIPLFKRQIAKGGPLTVTDKNVIRYFMTLSEAASLVIQASALSRGGEVFLLDMGLPVNIFELAKQMVKLSGFSIKDDSNKDGDIEIKTTGLRPGEKLYEELLINAKSESTSHPLIFKANEKSINSSEFLLKFSNFEKALEKRDKQNILKYLSQLVPEWASSI